MSFIKIVFLEKQESYGKILKDNFKEDNNL